MAGSKVFQFFLVSFVIVSTHALIVYLTHARGKWFFDHKTEINIRVDVGNGLRNYNGCAKNKTYVARPGTKKVIVYIRSEAQYLRETAVHESLIEVLWRAFLGYHYELLHLIVTDFRVGDEHIISDFLQQSIKPDPRQNTFRIDTIGEGDMNLNYTTLLGDLATYQEDENVFRGKLYERIRDLYHR